MARHPGTTIVRSELAVAVQVGPVASSIGGDAVPFTPWMSRDAGAPIAQADIAAQPDQHQQQQ